MPGTVYQNQQNLQRPFFVLKDKKTRGLMGRLTNEDYKKRDGPELNPGSLGLQELYSVQITESEDVLNS